MGGCGSSLRSPKQKQFRRAIKLYEVTEVSSMTNLLNRNKCFESGESPLTLAAREGHEAVVEALLRGGADPNKLDKNGRCPLHIAVYMNDGETVDILLENKANPNRYDENNTAPLHVACERGYADMVLKLLLADADPDEDRKGVSPLIHAVLNGHSECIELLLRHGGNPNVTDGRGNSALYLAVSNGEVECSKMLLKFDADLNATNRNNESLLCLASLNGNVNIVQALLQAGCESNVYNEDEVPPLIASVAKGASDCVEALVEAGADVESQDKKKQTALQIAIMSAIDTDRELYFCKYFSNVYRCYAKYDPLEIFPENCAKCAMSLVQGGAEVTKIWEKFCQVFPDPNGIAFEQMVLCEVLIQAFGFQGIPKSKLRQFVENLIKMREYGLVKLVYSAGVDPRKEDLYALSAHSDTLDREMFRYVKRLSSSPRQLKDLCRQKIRRVLSPNVLYMVGGLDVPQEMKEFVCIMDTEHYSKVAS